jgi:hypothetical protein
MFAFKRVRERCDALLSIGLEARDSGSLNLAAGWVPGSPGRPDDSVEEGGPKFIKPSLSARLHYPL